MDLSPTSGGPLLFSAPDAWRRYRERWTQSAFPDANVDRDRASFPAFLRASPNVMLADDHEFWNDYPHSSAWLLWSEHRPGLPLGRDMDRAFAVFQASLNCDAGRVAAGASLPALLANEARSFGIDLGGVRIFFLDTRTARTRYDSDVPRFAEPGWLAQVVAWLASGPGARVLFISQPLVEERAGWFQRMTHTMGDVNLPDYDEDFAALWEGLCNCPADVLVVSGDIHWSRLYQVKRPSSPNEIYELISSPLALIPGDPPSRGEREGKVEWERPRGSANWTRRYATNDAATYTTLQLQVLDDSLLPPVLVSTTAWGLPEGPAAGARLLRTSSFILRPRV
jgi:hypothetical protein